MNHRAAAIRAALVLWISHAVAAPPAAGDVVLQTGFDTPAERAAWSSAAFATWATGHQGTLSLRVTVATNQAAGGHMVRLPLDLTPYRGALLRFDCLARADQVTVPPAGHLGLKFMLHYRSPSAGPFWKNPDHVHGTFDWKPLSFTARIPPDAAAGELDLGLQDSAGTAWFDDVRITVAGRPRIRPDPPANPPPAFRGHDLPRLRGVMSPNVFREEDLRVLGGEWKANVIRWQLTRNWGRAGTDRDLAEYDRWLAGRLDELDRALDACRRHGLRVVIDMHSPPGGRHADNDLAIFHEPLYQDHWVAHWEKMARRYRGHPAVWGYDLINEPVQNRPSPPGVADYLGAQARAARAIRAIDPDTPIFIEAAEWDSPEGFRDLEPVDASNVIYQVHMYVPGEFTHQGVKGEWKPTAYPGVINGTTWDRDRLRAVLQPVREFQRAYNVHIFVGEFSAIRWAPGAADYLRDCIEVFEEYGWDWTYHAYREWDGWSVEHGPDPKDHQPTAQPTDRQRLLREWFGRNVRPDPPATAEKFQ